MAVGRDVGRHLLVQLNVHAFNPLPNELFKVRIILAHGLLPQHLAQLRSQMTKKKVRNGESGSGVRDALETDSDLFRPSVWLAELAPLVRHVVLVNTIIFSSLLYLYPSFDFLLYRILKALRLNSHHSPRSFLYTLSTLHITPALNSAAFPSVPRVIF